MGHRVKGEAGSVLAGSPSAASSPLARLKDAMWDAMQGGTHDGTQDAMQDAMHLQGQFPRSEPL